MRAVLELVWVWALLRGLLPAWYFAGGLNTGLGVYETHLFSQFPKLSIVDRFLKLVRPYWGRLAT